MFNTTLLSILLMITSLFAYADRLEANRTQSFVIVDDNGDQVTLNKPAQRIVVLAPHSSELLFEIGAGDLLVGAVDYSDYPEAAKKVPRVGGYTGLNIDAIFALKPDLIIYWNEGNNAREVKKLRDLGFTLYSSNPTSFEGIAHGLRQYGKLTGRSLAAEQQAKKFESKVAELRNQYQHKQQKSVFYQVWHQPLTTQGKGTFINHAIELCGGVNVFADLSIDAPQVSVEAVLERNPDLIVASGMGKERPEWLDDWQKYPFLKAVKNKSLFHIHPDLFHRPTSRFLIGTEMLCKNLDQVRQL